VAREPEPACGPTELPAEPSSQSSTRRRCRRISEGIVLTSRRGRTSGCTGAGAAERSFIIQCRCAGPVNLFVRRLPVRCPRSEAEGGKSDADPERRRCV
jgi:hypothetical protein